MIPTADYHMHTPLCGHAEGKPEEYAQAAVDKGLTEIGFSDHAPLVTYHIPDVCMTNEQLPLYQQMITDAREKFAGKLKIKIALEADFIPGWEKQTRAILDAYPYDYVIGSVHFIDGWCFDNPDELEKWDKVNVDEVYRRYYQLLQKAAQSKLFNVMGHVDLVKKFGHRPKNDLRAEINATARAFKENGVAIEINTSGLRKPVKEIYPSADALTIYQKAGVEITFGSDAHRPSEVGMNFDLARGLALAAGYKEYVLWEKRKIVGRGKL